MKNKIVVLTLLLYVIPIFAALPAFAAEATDVAFGKVAYKQMMIEGKPDGKMESTLDLTDDSWTNVNLGLWRNPDTGIMAKQSRDIFIDLGLSYVLEGTRLEFDAWESYAYPWDYKIYGSNDCYYQEGQEVPTVIGDNIVWEELGSLSSDPQKCTHELNLGEKTYRFVKFSIVDHSHITSNKAGTDSTALVLKEWKVYGVPVSNETTVSDLSITGEVKAMQPIRVSAKVVKSEGKNDPVLLAAVYSAEKKLLQVYKEIETRDGNLELTFDLPEALPEGAFIEAFVWDTMENMMPMIEKATTIERVTILKE